MLWNCKYLLRSGSDIRKVSVPIPDPNSEPNIYHNYWKQFFKTKIIVQNLAFLMLEAALFPRKLASHFLFYTIIFYFMLDPDPNPVPVLLRQKSAVSVPQHWEE